MFRLSLVVLVLTCATASAVSMNGKFGMGVGWTSAGLAPSYAVTKIGLGERLALEPTLRISTGSVTYGDSGGSGSSNSYDFGATAIFAHALMAHEKTNVYAKAGFGFDVSRVSSSSSLHASVVVPFGFGLEHFVSEHFSVDLNARMGVQFNVSKPPYGSSTQTRMNLYIGNEAVSAGLMWYH